MEEQAAHKQFYSELITTIDHSRHPLLQPPSVVLSQITLRPLQEETLVKTSRTTAMTSFYGYRLFFSAAVLLVLLCSESGQAEVSERRAAGSSLILPVGLSKDTIKHTEWKYEEKPFAFYRKGQMVDSKHLQFDGRLKLNNDNFSVEVMNLRLSDSGKYSIVVQGTGIQLPTKIISLTVYDVIKVQINISQAWKASTNSCDVHLHCQALEVQTVSYSWSGFKKENGAQLNFTLTPADGKVNLNCTANSNARSGSTSREVTCTSGKVQPGETGSSVNDIPWIWIAGGGGGLAALLLIIAIIGLSCWWKSHKEWSLENPGATVYEDVNVERKQSINVASIYETVDEHKISSNKPQTLYDKVTFARPPASGPSMPLPASQYQHVL